MRVLSSFLLLLVSFISVSKVNAHALEPGYLQLQELDADRWQVLWRVPDVNGSPMPIQAMLPDICSPNTSPELKFDGRAWLGRWLARCEGDITGQTVTIKRLNFTQTDVIVQISAEDLQFNGRLSPANISMTIPVKPTTWDTLKAYTTLGFEHILEGWDHLLFVFALMLLVSQPWRLFGAVTAFTAAHSVTLAGATLGFISLPGPPVEAVIALSIVFLANELANTTATHQRLTQRAPWLVTFSFGLLHGFGFAGALSDVGIPQGQIAPALLAFNVGVELGQIAFIVVAAAALYLILTAVKRITRSASPRVKLDHIASFPIGIVASFWLTERVLGFF